MTYFGVKVAWVGMGLPKWFIWGSIIMAYVTVVVKIISFFWILNALGDLGAKNLVGKGLWWSVRSQASSIIGWIFVNIGGFVIGIILPMIQAGYICVKGVRSHALFVNVSDNRKRQ